MNKDLYQLFEESTLGHVSDDFAAQTVEKIRNEADRISSRRKRLWGTISTLSLVAVVFAGRYAAQSFSQSGFGSYFSLLFSDSGSIFRSLNDFGLLLLESLPIIGVSIFLGSVCALLWSARKFFGETAPLPTISTTAY